MLWLWLGLRRHQAADLRDKNVTVIVQVILCLLLEIDSTAYLLFLPFLHRGLLLHRGLPLHRVPDLLHHELLALLLHRGLHHGLSRPCYPDCGERLELVLMLLKNVNRLIHVTFEPTIALILTTRGEYCCDCAAVTREDRM